MLDTPDRDLAPTIWSMAMPVDGIDATRASARLGTTAQPLKNSAARLPIGRHERAEKLRELAFLGDDWSPITTAPIAMWVLVADDQIVQEMQHLNGRWVDHAGRTEDFRPLWWRWKPAAPGEAGRAWLDAGKRAYRPEFTVGRMSTAATGEAADG